MVEAARVVTRMWWATASGPVQMNRLSSVRSRYASQARSARRLPTGTRWAQANIGNALAGREIARHLRELERIRAAHLLSPKGTGPGFSAHSIRPCRLHCERRRTAESIIDRAEPTATLRGMTRRLLQADVVLSSRNSRSRHATSRECTGSAVL